MHPLKSHIQTHSEVVWIIDTLYIHMDFLDQKNSNNNKNVVQFYLRKLLREGKYH